MRQNQYVFNLWPHTRTHKYLAEWVETKDTITRTNNQSVFLNTKISALSYKLYNNDYNLYITQVTIASTYRSVYANIFI